jgi:tryptophan synthase beta chain
MEAFALLCRTEGIIPAIESAHALAGAMVLGKELASRGAGGRGEEPPLLLVNLSGRGDKDVETASRWFGLGDRDEVDPGPGLDTDQQATEGAVTQGDAVAGAEAGEEL